MSYEEHEDFDNDFVPVTALQKAINGITSLMGARRASDRSMDTVLSRTELGHYGVCQASILLLHSERILEKVPHIGEWVFNKDHLRILSSQIGVAEARFLKSMGETLRDEQNTLAEKGMALKRKRAAISVRMDGLGLDLVARIHYHGEMDVALTLTASECRRLSSIVAGMARELPSG